MQKLQDASCLTHYISVTLVFHFIFNSCHNDSGGLAHRDTWKFPGGPSNQRPPKMYVPSSVFVSWFSGVIDQICTSITEWFSVNQDLIKDTACLDPHRVKELLDHGMPDARRSPRENLKIDCMPHGKCRCGVIGR